MAVIVIHAGMPKAGSSSIQLWLEKNWRALRERDFTLVVSPRDESGKIAFVPYEHGKAESGWMFMGPARKTPEERQRIAEDFADALGACAEQFGDLVVSSEHFSVPFWRSHRPTLLGLQRLSREHELRIAYYVRPQDSALEAAWRQAGFRTNAKPSAYIADNAVRMDYAATRGAARETAPDIGFEPKPFRADLLRCGDAVSDFAHSFLELETEGKTEWVNRGLPLEFVNALRGAPPAMFWDESYGNRRIARIKALVDGEYVPEDPRIALSRQVLRKFAVERFAEGNAELGWDDFVLPPENPDQIPGLEALDWLWTPSASPAELSFLFRVLRAAI